METWKDVANEWNFVAHFALFCMIAIGVMSIITTVITWPKRD